MALSTKQWLLIMGAVLIPAWLASWWISSKTVARIEQMPCGEPVTIFSDHLTPDDTSNSHEVISGIGNAYSCTLEFGVSAGNIPAGLELAVDITDTTEGVPGGYITTLRTSGDSADEQKIDWTVLPPGHRVSLDVSSTAYPADAWERIDYEVTVSRWTVGDVNETGDNLEQGAIEIEPGESYTRSHLCATRHQQFDITDYFTFELESNALVEVTVDNVELPEDDIIKLDILGPSGSIYVEEDDNNASLSENQDSARLEIDLTKTDVCNVEEITTPTCAGPVWIYVSNSAASFPTGPSYQHKPAPSSCKEPYTLRINIK